MTQSGKKVAPKTKGSRLGLWMAVVSSFVFAGWIYFFMPPLHDLPGALAGFGVLSFAALFAAIDALRKVRPFTESLKRSGMTVFVINTALVLISHYNIYWSPTAG